MMMKGITILYGANKKFVGGSTYVAENAIEEFTQMWIDKIRSWGWEKEITVRVWDSCSDYEIADTETNIETGAYVLSGFAPVYLQKKL